jgi:pSer/pThr/pTyr-binding forkhead associated (FHA) protein
MTTSGEICPSCKLRNKPGAILCSFCGAPLQGPPQDTRATDRLDEDDIFPARPSKYTDSLVPEVGLGIYLETTAPVTVLRDEEAILGRRASGTGGLIIDLVPFGAIQLGVSRRHATIHREETGYYITDLNSTNGTRVNGRRLLPNKPCRLSSGDIISLGRLSLLVLYK